MNNYVKPALARDYGIDLRLLSGQGNEIVGLLMREMEAGVAASEVDLVWINGETFYQLRQIDALFGPFTDQLPNSKMIDWANPFIAYDFQQPVEGFECPWGNVQMILIYDEARLKSPPQNKEALAAWLIDNPGRFTIGNDFTGMTLLKSWLIDFAGGPGTLDGPFDEAKYRQASDSLWAYLKRIKPYLWQQGQTFPNQIAAMHQLFANGELWFTMSNNDSEVDNKILQGVFPSTARAYVPEEGTIRNTHYLGIPKNAPQKAAAMVVCNFLISPAAQWEKMQPAVWGDGTILFMEDLPSPWQEQFTRIPGRQFAPDRSAILSKALAEPDPEYMIRLFEDFRIKIIEAN
jgi:putative spermidine/putrescine transport system substrate-binding protein